MSAQDFREFFAWALDEGYDVAHAYDTERSRWVFLSPMTAALWECWQFSRLGGTLAETTAEKTEGNAMKSTTCEPSKGMDTPTRD